MVQLLIKNYSSSSLLELLHNSFLLNCLHFHPDQNDISCVNSHWRPSAAYDFLLAEYATDATQCDALRRRTFPEIAFSFDRCRQQKQFAPDPPPEQLPCPVGVSPSAHRLSSSPSPSSNKRTRLSFVKLWSPLAHSYVRIQVCVYFVCGGHLLIQQLSYLLMPPTSTRTYVFFASPPHLSPHRTH